MLSSSIPATHNDSIYRNKPKMAYSRDAFKGTIERLERGQRETRERLERDQRETRERDQIETRERDQREAYHGNGIQPNLD